MSELQRLEFFVPSNRVSKSGRKRGFDGLNDIVGQSRSNRVYAAKCKNETEEWIAGFAREASSEQGWSRPSGLTTVELEFIEPDMRRDDDNVFAGSKFFLDALCTPDESKKVTVHKNGCSLVWDDDPFHVCLVTRRGPTDRENPGVKVRMTSFAEDEHE